MADGDVPLHRQRHRGVDGPHQGHVDHGKEEGEQEDPGNPGKVVLEQQGHGEQEDGAHNVDLQERDER